MTSPGISPTVDLRTPAWVVNVREEISRSPAWEVLSDQLYERVSTVLESHGLGHFSDLSSAEQTTLLEEAHRDISSEDNQVYQIFESQFGKSMDAEIAKEARARVDQDEAAKCDSTDESMYLDRILDSAAEGAVSLLKELPREHLGSLRLMLNQPVPSRARLEIWRLLLKHTAIREEYKLLMKQNRNIAISGQDIYITHRCQALLESGRVASRRLLPLTSRNVVLMKTVLSYHHACKMGKQGGNAAPDVPESFVHFLVPLCAVATSFSPPSHRPNATAASNPKEQKIERQIEGLVEMFEGALEAGLEGLVDPKEFGSGSGGGAARAGSVATTRAKKIQKAPKTARASGPPTTSRGGGGGGGTGEIALPGWVDKIHGVLIPGLKGLVDHVTRVHLGLTVAASPGGAASEHKREGDSDGDDGEASVAAHEKLQAGEKDNRQQQQQQQQLESESAAPPPSPRRVSATSRRAALQSRGRASSSSAAHNNSSGAGDSTTTAPDSADGGGREDRTAGNTSPRRRSSIVPPGEEEDNAKEISPVPIDAAPPPPSVNESQARAALHALLKPLVTMGLVGYLSADACLFAWDQAVIGGFGVMLPRVAAMVVAAAADKLQACFTFPVMSEALLSHAHLVSTSQLQELMEVHCMPSIRAEIRVSHKLSPEIIGPSLKTATEILHSAYSKRTRATQKARKVHVEHVLGPSKGGPLNRMNTEKRLQLDIPRATAHSSSDGSSADLHHGDSSDDNDNDDGDDDIVDTEGDTSASLRLGKARGRLDDRERQSKDRGSGTKKKGGWRGMLSYRGASSTKVSGGDGVGQAILTRDKRDDRSNARDNRSNTRDRRTNKRGAKGVEPAAATAGSAAASKSASKKVGDKKRGNKEPGLPDVNNAKFTKPKKNTTRTTDHDPTSESADDTKAVVTTGSAADSKSASKKVGDKKRGNKEPDLPDVNNAKKTKPKKNTTQGTDHDPSKESTDDTKAVATVGSAAASKSASKKVGGKKRGDKEPGLPDVNNAKKTKLKKKITQGTDHDPSNESTDDTKAVDVGDHRNPGSKRQLTAGTTAGARRDSSASSSSLPQENTGSSLESSQYFSMESQSALARGSEGESSEDDDQGAVAGEEGAATRSSDRRRRSRSSRRRKHFAEERSSSVSPDEGSPSIDGQAGRKREKRERAKSSALLAARKASGSMSDSSGGGSGGSGGGAEGGNRAVGNKAKKETPAAEATKGPRRQPDTKEKEKSSSRRRRSSQSHVSHSRGK